MRVAWFSGAPATAASPMAEDSAAVEDRRPWVLEAGDAASGKWPVGDRGMDGMDGLPPGRGA